MRSMREGEVLDAASTHIILRNALAVGCSETKNTGNRISRLVDPGGVAAIGQQQEADSL
jgi:hypothetical protein